MKNKSLSWKVLLPLAVVLWVIGAIIGGVIADGLNLLALIMGLMGVIDAFRAMGKSVKKDTNS